MNSVAGTILILYFLYSAMAFIWGYRNAILQKNIFGETPYLLPLGIFVWGDAVIIGSISCIVSLILYIISDGWLALLVWSIFWVVRSHGETVYWLNQQFSPIERNKPSDLIGYRWFPNDSLWFVYQLWWQCVTVFALIAAIYSTHMWLNP